MLSKATPLKYFAYNVSWQSINSSELKLCGNYSIDSQVFSSYKHTARCATKKKKNWKQPGAMQLCVADLTEIVQIVSEPF